MSMFFPQMIKYPFLIFGIIFIYLAIDSNVVLNSNDAVDLSTTGIVISKYTKPGNARKNRKPKFYIYVFYNIDSNLDLSPKSSKKIAKLRIKTLKSRRINEEKVAMAAESFANSKDIRVEDLIYKRIQVGALNFRRMNINDEIELFYRSNSPTSASLNLESSRSAIPLTFGIGVFLILFALIAFYKTRPSRN